MKKVMSLFLALAFLLTALPFAVAEEGFSLPAVGGGISGFTVRSISRLDMLNADVVLYEHEKTGALVMLIENEDTNRTFEITFHTIAQDNTGVPHIFEHSTLDGSEKYPSKSLFFNLLYQTYNTYMNAATYQFMTTFPLASLSEEQLLSLADYFADSCFHPMICEDESIFRDEAWRYALDDADDDLSIEGTVYSEMGGAYDLSFASSLNINRTIFPGSVSNNNHGGTPSEIPNMTWEDVKAYHDLYYHPSNSLTCLYGKIERPESFLELLDGYFSQYEKAEIDFTDKDYVPITGPVYAEWEYPMPSGADTKNGSNIQYGFVCTGCDEEKFIKVDMLMNLLNRSSSILSQKLNAILPYASVSCWTDYSTPVPCIVFEASNVNPEDAETFRKTVDEAMAETLEKGFDPDAVSAVASAKELDLRTMSESSSVGINLIPEIGVYWSCFDDPFGFEKKVEMSSRYEEYAEDGTFAQLIREYVVENERNGLSVTVPVAGLKDEEDAALARKLAEVKAEMSEEEIAAILAVQEEKEDDPAEYLRQLKSVSVEELPEEARIYEISDETGEDSVRRILASANTEGIGEALVMLNASSLTKEELLTFKLYTLLLGGLDTTRHTRAELSALITRYLYSPSLRFSVIENENGEAVPHLRGSFVAVDDDMEAAYDLLYEIFFETKFEDVPTIQGTISSQINSLRQSIDGNPLNMLFYRGFGNVSQASACFSYVNFADFYHYLCETEKRMQTEPEAVLEELRRVQQAVNTSSNAISAFIGSEESARKHRAVADAFLNRLTDTPVVQQKYEFAPSAKTEAYITDSPVQFNVRFASYEDLGLGKFSGVMEVLNSLMSDAYMLPMLRDQYGAYGAYAASNIQTGEFLYTYSDPYIAETAEVFDSIADNVRSILSGVSQETLDGYILSAYSGYALSSGELSGGLSAVLDMLSGIDQQDKLTYMKQIKNLTVEELLSFAQFLDLLTEKGSFLTAGSASAINANADRYEVIVNLFGAEE